MHGPQQNMLCVFSSGIFVPRRAHHTPSACRNEPYRPLWCIPRLVLFPMALTSEDQYGSIFDIYLPRWLIISALWYQSNCSVPLPSLLCDPVFEVIPVPLSLRRHCQRRNLQYPGNIFNKCSSCVEQHATWSQLPSARNELWDKNMPELHCGLWRCWASRILSY